MQDMLKSIRRSIKCIVGRAFIARLDISCETVFLGSEYGGWTIVPSGLNPSSVVYSFGVGEDASFDRALIDRFALTVHAFDPTPKSIAWVNRQAMPNRFVMHDYGVADVDGDIMFNPPEDPEAVSHTILERPATHAHAISISVKRLASIMQELGHRHIDVLKLDVEGAEYQVIEDMRRTRIRPRQVLVEFHHRFPNVGIFKTKAAIKILREMGYLLFSISASNEEYCFLIKQKERTDPVRNMGVEQS